MELAEIRKEIDGIDPELLKLFFSLTPANMPISALYSDSKEGVVLPRTTFAP